MRKKNNKSTLFIVISSEDDVYRVAGGIGTYLGLLTRTQRNIDPTCEIHWITKSPTSRSFQEKDPAGVFRHYLGCSQNSRPFARLPWKADENLFSLLSFQRAASDTVYALINKSPQRPTIIEVGDWEGHGAEIFHTLSQHTILKVARLHTPLATCIRQNHLPSSAANSFQLLAEYQTLVGADLLSASTQHVKKMVEQDVFGKRNHQHPPISIFPNPIDTTFFSPQPHKRTRAIQTINRLAGRMFLTPQTTNIFIVGSVERRKGVEVVMKSIPAILQKNPLARICFIGHHGGNAKSHLTANTKMDPRDLYKMIPNTLHHSLFFTGYIDHKQLPTLLQAGDLFPIMSVNDNFPGTVAEISLTAKPIIYYATGGVKEMLQRPNGSPIGYSLGSDTNGLANRLAKAVDHLSNDKDLQQKIGIEQRSLMISKYDPTTITKNMYTYYHKVLTRKMGNGKI